MVSSWGKSHWWSKWRRWRKPKLFRCFLLFVYFRKGVCPIIYKLFKCFFYDDDVLDIEGSDSSALFTVADSLQKLYGGKVYVCLRIPDADSASRQSIDVVLVTKGLCICTCITCNSFRSFKHNFQCSTSSLYLGREIAHLWCAWMCSMHGGIYNEYATEPGFIIYTVVFVILVSTLILYCAPKYGQKHLVIYVGICSLTGSLTVMGV